MNNCLYLNVFKKQVNFIACKQFRYKTKVDGIIECINFVLSLIYSILWTVAQFIIQYE